MAYEKLTLWKPGRTPGLDPRPHAGGSSWDQSPDHRARRDRQDRALPGDRPGLGESARDEISPAGRRWDLFRTQASAGDSLWASVAVDRRLPRKQFSDEQLIDVLRKVGLERLIARVGGLDPEHDWPARPVTRREPPPRDRQGPPGGPPIRVSRSHGRRLDVGPDRPRL